MKQPPFTPGYFKNGFVWPTPENEEYACKGVGSVKCSVVLVGPVRGARRDRCPECLKKHRSQYLKKYRSIA